MRIIQTIHEYIYIYIYGLELIFERKTICFFFFSCSSNFRNVENIFLLLLVQIGGGWSLSNRGDEFSMCNFKEIDF